MDGFQDDATSYECVEPRLGDQLWRYTMPDLEQDLRTELEDHLSVCASCRLELAMQERLANAIADGTVRLPAAEDSRAPRHPGWLSRTISWGAATAIAACLALIFVLPPRVDTGKFLLRGDDSRPRIERPVSGEVTLSRRPLITWTPVENATGYQVTLRSSEGRYSWSTGVDQPRVTVPDSAAVPTGERLQVFVRPVPEYLGPPEGMSSSFQVGTLAEFVGYRPRVAPFWLLGLAGFAVLILVLVRVFGSR